MKKHWCHYCGNDIPEKDIGGYKNNNPICLSCCHCIMYNIPITNKKDRAESETMKNEIQKYEGTELSKLKDFMYDILEIEDDDQQKDSIVANQGMGVQLSNAMKKDGVTIVQMQNVVNKKVTTNVVKSLRLIDKLLDNSRSIEIEQTTPAPQITLDHLIQVIAWLADKGLKMKDFDNLMRGLYCREQIKVEGSTTKAAEKIGVSQAHVSKLNREVDTHLDNIDSEPYKLEVLD